MNTAYELCPTSIEELIATSGTGRDSGLAFTFNAGGFYVTNVTQEFADHALQVGFGEITLGTKLVYLSDLSEVMTAEQIDAILMHEIAHIELGHLNNLSESDIACGFSMNLENEIAADAVAAKKYGGEFVIGALQATIRGIVSLGNKYLKKNVDPEEVVAHFTAEPHIQARINALKSFK